jgi:orotidine-5'-phosphate decarboxylase
MLRLAAVVDKAGIDGLVVSGREIEVLKKDFGNRFVLVVTGIRL